MGLFHFSIFFRPGYLRFKQCWWFLIHISSLQGEMFARTASFERSPAHTLLVSLHRYARILISEQFLRCLLISNHDPSIPILLNSFPPSAIRHPPSTILGSSGRSAVTKQAANPTLLTGFQSTSVRSPSRNRLPDHAVLIRRARWLLSLIDHREADL